MSGPTDLAERLVAVIQQQATNVAEPALDLSVSLTVRPYKEGASKRDRARQALAGKGTRKLAEVARRMGVHLGDYALEEVGLALLEEGATPIYDRARTADTQV